MIADAQKSEVHATTADASTSPAAGNVPVAVEIVASARPHLHLSPPAHTEIVRDDTDVGGPLVITSDDPDLNPPRVPIDPFPTDATPEIDPPVAKAH
jgi:hypothetical protein